MSIIITKRLTIRNWKESDIPLMTAINQDPEVMRFFPSPPTPVQTHDFVLRMQNAFDEYGFCYFAVDRNDTNEFIGFIGLLHQDYESDFTPFVDIGWRLKKGAWGNGFATEGAKACLKFGFKEMDLSMIYSTATVGNTPSISVMKKIGMKKEGTFNHPLLVDHPQLQKCAVYSRSRRGD